jgi:hypothetical protein
VKIFPARGTLPLTVIVVVNTVAGRLLRIRVHSKKSRNYIDWHKKIICPQQLAPRLPAFHPFCSAYPLTAPLLLLRAAFHTASHPRILALCGPACSW